MPSRHRPDPEEEDPPEVDDGAEAEEAPAPPPRKSRKGGKHADAAGQLNEWDPDADMESAGKDWLGRPKKPVYWRARDSLWFEPLVALMIVVLLVVGLFAYTQNWPPLYVVESDSMQHGTGDTVGLINTGDLVLAQKIDPSQITTYVVGMQTGYTTYGEYGDVILYHPDGVTDSTPVIHRAIIYLHYDGAHTWSYPSVSGLACTGPTPAFTTSGTNPCANASVSGSATLTLYNIGWQGARVVIPLDQMGVASGFVTMGDNNVGTGNPPQGEPDQTYGISGLVQTGWIVGVARGMVPWFGSLKLLLEGQTSQVPSQSWELMGLTIAGALLIALGVHLALRRHAPRDDAEEEASGSWLPAFLRGKGGPGEEGDGAEGDDDAAPVKKVKPVPKEKLLSKRHGAAGGRPRPKVRRGTDHGHRSRPPADAASEEL